jgi:short-subunit dehydrogenase
MNLGTKNKVALATGASKGIGKMPAEEEPAEGTS